MNRKIFLAVGVIALLAFVGLESGFADISSIQEQLKSMQLTVIKEKIKQVQEQIYGVLKNQQKEPPKLNREQLAKSLDDQIKALESIVAKLKPKVVEEEAARIEKRMQEINVELETASNDKLMSLQTELEQLLVDQDKVQDTIKQSLEDGIEYKQALLLKGQVALLQEKLRLLPQAQPPAPVTATPTKKTESLQEIQTRTLKEKIEKTQLQLLQVQIGTIQDKINQVKK